MVVVFFPHRVKPSIHSTVLSDRESFNLHNVLRTPYRIDIMQPVYYVLDDIRQLYQLSQTDLMSHVEKAMAAGLLPPLFTPKEETHA